MQEIETLINEEAFLYAEYLSTCALMQASPNPFILKHSNVGRRRGEFLWSQGMCVLLISQT
jgi:hypothetical protein